MNLFKSVFLKCFIDTEGNKYIRMLLSHLETKVLDSEGAKIKNQH